MITLKKQHRRYDKYQALNLGWLQDIPSEWDIGPALSLVDENQDLNDSGEEKNVLSLSYGNIVNRDISDNYGLLPESFNTYQVIKPGYIVLRLTDLQNDHTSLRVGYSNNKGIITSAYVGLVPKKGLIGKYIYYLLHSYDLNKIFYSMGGGVRQGMNFSDIKRLPIIIPSQKEQESIIYYLDEKCALIDRIIEGKKKQIEILQEQRAAVINQAVIKGLDESVEMKESGVEWIGEIPASWRVEPLKKVAPFVSRGNSPDYNDIDEGIPVINQACVYWNKIDIEKLKYHRQGDISKMKGKLRDEDVLINSTGTGTLGRAVVYRSTDISSAIADGHVTIIRTKKEKLYPNYLTYLFSTALYQGYIYAALVNGSTNQIELSKEGIRRMPVILPGVQIQESIVFYLNKKCFKIDALIKKIERSISIFSEYKTSLISHAVTGKIKVS